ncbi:MAG TPA: hypothetical protein VL087_00135 [Nitrospirota bacterium]|nr:hypothetical protein [Nitrospirota bacterium]
MKKLVTNNKVSVFSMLMLTILLFAATVSAQPSYLVIDLGGLGGTTSVGTTSVGEGINDNGQVTGQAAITSGYIHAFLYSGGTMTDLGTLGGTTSVGSDINNSGQIVGGAALTGDTAVHAFLYSGGIMADLGTLGGTNSESQAINNSSQIVGEANLTGDTAQHAFLYSGGIMADLGTLGGTNSFGFGINTSGQIVGVSDLSGDAASHAFLYSSSTMTDLGTLGGSDSRANGINDSGKIVGSSYLSGDAASHAILYSGGTMTDLGTLGGDFSTAFGINISGLIVGGSFLTGDTVQHAFLYSGGTMYDLNNLIPSSSGWVLGAGQGINNAGQIVGWGAFNGTLHAFLLTPGAVAPVATGTNVSVALGPQVALTFSDVVTGGSVTAMLVLTGSLPTPPPNFAILGGTSSYDIVTDATFTGQVEVCIVYDPTKITVPEQLLRLYHYSGGSWTDITLLPVDIVNKQVCGLTSTFSTFAVLEPIYTPEALSIRYAAVQFWNKQDSMGNVLLWADFKVPMPAASDVITGTFDSVTLFSAPFSTFKRVLPNVYWDVKNGYDITIDFKLGQIIVITPTITLTGLDNSNGVYVQFTISGSTGMEIGFQNITMTPEPGNRLVYRRPGIFGNPL